MSVLDQAPVAYTFDDFMLEPGYSEIPSRKYPDVSVSVGRLKYQIPIVASPMNTVTGTNMVRAMHDLGGTAVLHRYMSIEDQVAQTRELLKHGTLGSSDLNDFWVAVGANGDAVERTQALADAGATRFCIDVANGHTKHCIEAVHRIRKAHPNAMIMAGNVCTYDGTLALADAGADAIRVGIGPGCHAAGTRVLMSNMTYKNIEDVKAGDMVINMHGEPVTVKHAWKTGIRKVNKLRHTQFYKPTYCTPDHKYYMGTFGSLSGSTIKSRGYAGSIKNTDWNEIGNTEGTLLMPNNINYMLKETFNIRLNKKDNFKYEEYINITPSYESGYIFGLFLGDGTASVSKRKDTHTGQVSWALNSAEHNTINKIKKAIMTVFGRECKEHTVDNVTNVILNDLPFARYMQNFGKKHNKHLPEDLLTNNSGYLKGLLDGLIDSDGHIENKTDRVGFTNTSERLMELYGVLEFIVNGSFPNVRSKGLCTSALVVNAREAFVSRRLKNASARMTKDNEFQLIKVLENSVEQIEVPVYDIEVDCPTHSFIANNAIVHNSMCTTRMVTGHGVPQLTAIEQCALIHHAHPDVTIIADGGLRHSGDIIKALAIGADMVMLGSLLAGTSETPGDVIRDADGQLYKWYHGMASEKGREEWFGREQTSFVPEGASTKVAYKGETFEVVEQLVNGLRVGMSYAGVDNLHKLRLRPKWVRVTGAGHYEGTPHGKQ